MLVNATKGNDTWACVIVDSESLEHYPAKESPITPSIQTILQQYHAGSRNLTTIRSYDHAIPLVPDAVPVNARPYHYSPQHKTEIQKPSQTIVGSWTYHAQS